MIRRPLNIFGASCDGSTPEHHVGGDAGVKTQRRTVMQDNEMVFDAESTPEYEEFVEKF